MKWAVYNLLFAFVYPFLLPGFLIRMVRRGGYAARMGDRFALYPDGLFGGNRPLFDRHAPSRQTGGAADAPVWIHAVSVGEVQVAGQLMREWRKVEPDVRFCFSTTSSTGWKMAEREVTAKDVLIYNPLDFPNFVKSALRTVRPRAVVLTESELWPNFILQARRHGIPLYLINARVSDRSAPRYRLARFFFRDVLAAFTRIFAQSELDKARLVAAGAPADRIEVTGSFKFDVAHRNEAKERELRDWIGEGRILLGGSTWPGEDEALLRLYRRLVGSPAASRPDAPLKLVLAPRHFEKADAVEANIGQCGFRCVRRSRPSAASSPSAAGAAPAGTPPVYLADTTGELMGLYGIADVVFVGKSLCAHGAQNMIEPCLCGKPTVVGPHTENFRPVMSDLLAAEAIVQVGGLEELAAQIERLLADDGGLGARAQAAVARRQGVVAKCVASVRGSL
ncbi:MAG: 3-deoxy-D-manno-octulosonic acid transferase [Kiritimatiellia bacterium]